MTGVLNISLKADLSGFGNIANSTICSIPYKQGQEEKKELKVNLTDV